MGCPQPLAGDNSPGPPDVRQEALAAYNDSLQKLIASGLKYQRLDFRTGISVKTPDGRSSRVAIAFHGFPWQPGDFDQIQIAEGQGAKKLNNYWQRTGLGVPLIAVRQRPESRDFLGPVIPFAATAVLHPGNGNAAHAAVRTAGQSASTDDSSDVVATLDLYDPLHVTYVNFGAVEHELTRDISAPLAFVSAEVDRNNWRDFLRPGTDNGNMGLRMLQPYQPGKIPVVLVHGLLSDKFTWIQMVNDLRSVPWINERFQIWTFQYYTGQPFLRSGAELRQALSEAINTFDPQHTDPAMGQMVLVGHSMGGLVSKLQVTSSKSILWDEIASRPFNEVAFQPEDRQQVSQLFFFEPLPSVQRVLFIGTPHQGSFWANNSAGRLGSTLVSMPKDRVELLQTLVKNNPDVFSKYLRKGIPTSIDLLRPDSPLLLGMRRLPISPAVSLHSIVGTGSSLSDGTPADGIVPVSSAMHPTPSARVTSTRATANCPIIPIRSRKSLRILAELVDTHVAGKQLAARVNGLSRFVEEPGCDVCLPTVSTDTPPHPSRPRIGDVAECRAGRGRRSSRLSEHRAYVCAPPAGARRVTLAGQPTSCREQTTGFLNVSLANNALNRFAR